MIAGFPALGMKATLINCVYEHSVNSTVMFSDFGDRAATPRERLPKAMARLMEPPLPVFDIPTPEELERDITKDFNVRSGMVVGYLGEQEDVKTMWFRGLPGRMFQRCVSNREG